MANITSPFSIPIIQDIISEESYLLIKEEVMEYLKQNNNNLNTPWDCPTQTSLFLPPERNFESQKIENEIKKITNNYVKEWDFITSFNIKIVGLWVNVSKKGSFQEYHRHINSEFKSLFSGTLYIDVNENSGNLNLINPLDSFFQNLPKCLNNPLKLSITPQPGLIVSFPSFIGHYVGENKNETNRISVSWNVIIDK
mgnify:CR=1 FL=1|tara:strand:+ start:56 stop:646 length:591 start_codon:yes stop_codon:yes gene_type:complete